MLRLVLTLFAPGEKLPPGTTQYALGYEGISWGWAFFAFVVLVAGVIWSYHRYAPGVGRITRISLILLRSILLGLLLILLVRPVLLITIEETVRRPLLVLLDSSQSMTLGDQRGGDDLVRAAIATGAVEPAGGLKQSPPTGDDKLKSIPRRDLLEGLAANEKMNLWPRLNKRSSLQFFGFGRKLGQIGELAAPENSSLTTDESAVFFHGLHDDENLTAIGDGLRELLDDQRGQSISGILLITDGANNTGSSPIEAAAIAKQDGVPLFIYGIGVTSPQDILVAELSGPQVSNVKEKLNVTARIRAQSMMGRKATIQLKADGKVVDEQPIEFRADGEQEITLSYTPAEVGMANLEAFVPPLPEEAVKDNNSAQAQVRIVDDKLKVLLVEEEPSWDFQYLLAMLQRDRRFKVKCVLLKGDADLGSQPDSPFLDAIPADKETLYANDLIILGDVDPAELGDARMKLLNDWVSKMGGGLLFKAGPNFNPNAYHDTPLDPLLPVEAQNKTAEEYPDPVPLKMTPTGETSAMFSLSHDPAENASIWAGFTGVRWTAWVGKARPGAQVLLVDPTESRATAQGPMPVIALQNYGLGQSLYIGFDETYRWRSKQGEKYYTQIWSQMIQVLTAQHTVGASALTQLKTDRPSYLTGDKVRISGRIFQAGFQPLTDAEVPGTVTLTPTAKPGQPALAPITKEVRLQAIADLPGEYRADVATETAGTYSYSTARDPAVVVKWEVDEPRVEFTDIAMHDKLLKAMAAASGGHFVREEDLNGLPELIASQTAGAVSFKKIPLAFAPLLFALIVLIGCVEWLWRRTVELK
jgi:von Willebrand factor type A domain